MLTTLNGNVCTNCPYRYSFKYKKTLEKKRNVPRKCPVPMCPASPFTLNIQCHLQLVHPGLDPKTMEVSDWIVQKQIAWPARKTRAEKGEKVRWITIHVDKEAEEGTGQATTTGDEGGDKYGTQQLSSEADEDWRPKRRKSDGPDGSDTDSLSTTSSSSGGTSSTSSESSSESGSLDGNTKVVVATGHKKVYKKTAKQPRGQAKQAQSGKTALAASSAQQQQAPKRKSSSDSKRQRSRRLLEVHREVHKTLRRGLWDERSASSALRGGYCSESHRWVYPVGSFFLGCKVHASTGSAHCRERHNNTQP